MKINKHIVLGLLIFTTILTLGFYIISMPFRLANMIDGEVVVKSEVIKKMSDENEYTLIGNYYLDERTFQLFQKIDKNLSKVIIENKIDSLCWTETKIIGHINQKYFMIDVLENDSITIKYYIGKTNLCKVTNMLKPYYNRFYKVPVIYGFKSSKF